MQCTLKKIFFLFFSFTVFFCAVNAQTLQKAASDAYIITRMAAKFHVQPRPVDDVFSNDLYSTLLKELDGQRIFFTTEDISRLEPYRVLLDDQLKSRKTDFLQLLITLYQAHISQADTMIDNICKTPFNFSLPEKLTVVEDTSFAANTAAQHAKIYKLLKLSVLTRLSDYSDKISALNTTLQKKYIDSAEASLRKKAEANFKRFVSSMLQSPGGLQEALSNVYCEAVASCYDPHTAYFPLTEKENFESELGNGSFEFGFAIDDADGGGAVINNLKPAALHLRAGY